MSSPSSLSATGGGGRPAAMAAAEAKEKRWRNGQQQPSSSEVTAQVFARPLHDGAVAVVLLNRGEAAANLTVDWRQLGLADEQRMMVRDVGNRHALPDAAGQFGSLVGKHDVAFVRLTPVD